MKCSFSEDIVFACDQCQYTTNIKGNTYEIAQKYTLEGKTRDFCEATFEMKKHLKKHKATHGEDKEIVPINVILYYYQLNKT